MPKLIDHAQRRRLIVNAAWSVVAEDGAAALTVRRVAEAARIVPGSLRYIFETQESLLDAVADELVQRVRTAVAAGASRYPRQQDLPLRMLALVPLMTDDVQRWRVEHALYVGASRHPRLDEDIAQCRNARRAECATIIRNLHIGIDVPQRHVDAEVLRALALVEGLSHLAAQGGASRIEAHEAQVIVRRHLLDVQTLLRQREASAPHRTR
ncbi:AcrR family transcriptional regulator [Microbacterium sp. AK009]|uniref:TetR/AcrR family transcriptional regulator n=1 Tax=Microbacterium sp. AK009 TaxID=2723068 RepID=UPI0015CA13AD|nr:TetR family transcriptional regulator [Microbacterium sp. AK009]NYF17010.1 AcrR family transcriptional regulator [Microbacterium sp. AK009]